MHPLGNPLTPYLNFYGREHCSRDSFLNSMLKKSDWHPFKPLSTNHQQGIANFRILVVFAHLWTPIGDPSTPYLNIYGLKHCSKDSFLSSMLKKSDKYPLKPLSTHHQQGIANFRILDIFCPFVHSRGGPLNPIFELLWLGVLL